MTNPEKDTIEGLDAHLVDEMLIVRHSGEIPEVALHGSLYYLTSAPDGPGLALTEQEVAALKGMVVERYLEIIRRDLDPGNRDKTFYRGIRRAAVNWRRLRGFCRREGLVHEAFRPEFARSLAALVTLETEECLAGRCLARACNCDRADLLSFTEDLLLDLREFPPGWERICQEGR